MHAQLTSLVPPHLHGIATNLFTFVYVWLENGSKTCEWINLFKISFLAHKMTLIRTILHFQANFKLIRHMFVKQKNSKLCCSKFLTKILCYSIGQLLPMVQKLPQSVEILNWNYTNIWIRKIFCLPPQPNSKISYFLVNFWINYKYVHKCCWK